MGNKAQKAHKAIHSRTDALPWTNPASANKPWLCFPSHGMEEPSLADRGIIPCPPDWIILMSRSRVPSQAWSSTTTLSWHPI